MSSEAVTSETDASHEPLSSLPKHTDQADKRMQSTTPRSSPLLGSSPPVAEQGDADDAMPPPSRKRSHEDMRDERENAVESSATVDGEPDLRASQVKPSDSQSSSSATDLPSTSAHAMPPPPSAAPLSMLPPSHKAPRSSQGLPKPQAQAQQPPAPIPAKAPEKAPPTVQKQANSDDTIPDDDESAGSSTPSEPQDQIEDFDWKDLEQRYHEKMRELDGNERAILNEFDALCNYFGVWASTSQTHEVGRSFKRLKTQTTYVQHEEDELEQKRNHYIKVVEAFKSALLLLGN